MTDKESSETLSVIERPLLAQSGRSLATTYWGKPIGGVSKFCSISCPTIAPTSIHGQYGQAGQGCSPDRDDRGRSRSRLLQCSLTRGWS